MRIKLIIGHITIKTRPWWNPFSRAPVPFFRRENLYMGELVSMCETRETSKRGLLVMYWAKDPECPKGDEFVLMKVDPYYHEEWLAGDACGLLGIKRSKK